MHMTPHIRPECLETFMRRGRELRSAAAIAVFASIGRSVFAIIERAFVRPYRMTRTPGCGCEA